MSKFLIVLLAVFSSCCGVHNEAEYRYGNSVVRRVDECGKTSFFYGNNSGKIWVEYSGINDGFSGYLKFNEDGSVILYSGDGYFQSAGLDTTKLTFKRVSYDAPIVGGPVCAIMLSTKHEIERNQKAKSEVKATYNSEEDE
jgi:hypothetical protein